MLETESKKDSNISSSIPYSSGKSREEELANSVMPVDFIKATGFNEFTSSSSLDFPDEYGIDEEMLESFFDSVSNTYYEVA